MARRLPPLTALRAFEAAARHLSITRAAEELHVTRGAVSQQIRALEEYFGAPLFRRRNRSILLTNAGQTSMVGLSRAFDKIEAVADQIRADRAGERTLTISTAPSFAAKWLVPRLYKLNQTHPQIEIRLSASVGLVDFFREDIDLAVRFGKGGYPGLKSEKLFSESVTPMCSRRLLEGDPPLNKPADIRHHTLLHDESHHFGDHSPDWSVWAEMAGVPGLDTSRGLHFAQTEYALQTAIDGLGVTLSRARLAAADIEAGRLVCPFDLAIPLNLAYHLVGLEAAFLRPKVIAFRQWLLEECEEMNRRRPPAMGPLSGAAAASFAPSGTDSGEDS